MLETYGLKPNELGYLTERQYRQLLNQCENIKRYNLGGKINLETEKDKNKRMENEVLKRLGNG